MTSISASKKTKRVIPKIYWMQMKAGKGIKRIRELFEKRANVAAHPKIEKLKYLLT